MRIDRSTAGSFFFFSLLFIFAGCSGKREEITIAFSNDTRGQIRSCGCVAKDLGGLGRRATFVRMSRDTSDNFILLDAGDFFGGKINYVKEKAEVTLKSMALMGYDGIVPGEMDFGFGLEYLRDRAKAIGLPLLAANLYAADSLVFPPMKTITLKSGRKVALIGLMGDRLSLPPQARGDRLHIRSPEATLKTMLEKLEGKVDLVFLLAHMPKMDAIRLAREVGGIDVVICGHEGRAIRRVRKFNGAYVLQVPMEGKYMGVAGATITGEGELSSLEVRIAGLTDSYPDDEAVTKLFKAYDMEISLKEKADIAVGVLKEKAVGAPFSGAGKCRSCHEDAFGKWKVSKHARAFQVLQAKSRQYDRDCTPCHTTGFYKEGGFVNLAATPELVNVQCEACHGNGARHASDPETAMKEDASSACRGCHTKDQSPDFEFETYWRKIAH